MNIWLENSIKNLIPLSEEKSDFKKALMEWEFTGEIIDHGLPVEVCRLCEKEGIRFQFEIRNQLTNTLLVGSKCIEKFDITVYNESGIEVKENKDAYLLKLARSKHVHSALDRLKYTHPSGGIKGHPKINLDEYCVDKYDSSEKLDPKMINYLFLRLEEESIPFDKKYFSINLRGKENKEKLLSLERRQYIRIKPALSIRQRNFYEKNKK